MKQTGKPMMDIEAALVDRGVKLFRKLVDRANQGEAVGISYKSFVEHVHGVPFAELQGGRKWRPSDASNAVRLADRITTAASGRKKVRRPGVVIQAGMDTFIWPKKPPHVRSPKTWNGSLCPPYPQTDWLAVFQEGTRRLVDDEDDE